jgi:hypothetical protein
VTLDSFRSEGGVLYKHIMINQRWYRYLLGGGSDTIATGASEVEEARD